MKVWTVPNLLTIFRLFLIPFFVCIFYLPLKFAHAASAFIFFVGALTDWLDGFLARYLGQASDFGAFLDPVVDKLMVGAALVLLVSAYPTWWVSLPGVVIVSREIVISALREWMAEMGKRSTVKVSLIGKLKTTMQMVSILLLLAIPPIDSWIASLGFILLYIAAILTLWSMSYYLMAAWRELA